jgi:IclR family KDG regulon transcriptional repressor
MPVLTDRTVPLQLLPPPAPAVFDTAAQRRVSPGVAVAAMGVEGSCSGGVIERAIALIEAFSADGPAGVSELARRAGLPKSTTHRLLGILEKCQLVHRVPDGYELGQRLYALAKALSGDDQSLRLQSLLRPYLADAYALANETAHVGIIQGDGILYLDELHGRRRVALPAGEGDRVPAHCTAIGKVLLAFSPGPVRSRLLRGGLPAFTTSTITSGAQLEEELTRIQRRGVAFDRGEFVAGATSVAALITGADGLVAGAISITGPISRFDPARFAAGLARIGWAASASLRSRAC